MRIVVDDAADIAPELVERYKIAIIPVNIHFGTEQFLSRVEMDLPAFYQRIQSVDDASFPKTSQPSPYQFEQFFRGIIEEGDTEILAITVGQKLSGTYASAVAARQALQGQANITLFSSESASAAQGFMAVTAARMFEHGANLEQVLARLEQMRREQVLVLVFKTLDFAARGGRVSGLRSAMASLLNIKPVMHVFEGEVVEAGKVRTHSKARRFMIDFAREQAGDRPVMLAVLHGGEPEAGQSLLQEVEPLFQATESYLLDLCIAVAINIGPGALGIVAIPEVARHRSGA